MLRRTWGWGLLLFIALWLAALWNYDRMLRIERYPRVETNGEIRLGTRDSLARKSSYPRFLPFAGEYPANWPGWLSFPEGSYLATSPAGQQMQEDPVAPDSVLVPAEKGYRLRTKTEALIFMNADAVAGHVRQSARDSGIEFRSVDSTYDRGYLMQLDQDGLPYQLSIELTPVNWPGRDCTHAAIIIYSKGE